MSREINQSKTTSVRILSLALVISCLHFRGYVIFNLIIFHLQRVSFSLCLKITGTSRREIDLLEKMLTRKSKPEIGQEDEKGSLASILALFFKSTGSVSYLVKNMDLFVSLVGLDYGRWMTTGDSTTLLSFFEIPLVKKKKKFCSVSLSVSSQVLLNFLSEGSHKGL